MDRNDPAWRLAEATLASTALDADALDAAFRELRPTARDVARAYALCITTRPYSQTEATRLILSARLQVTLMEEHVSAQHRMGLTINILTGVLVVLTLVLVIFGEFDMARLFSGRG